jgi:hypothetical protein
MQQSVSIHISFEHEALVLPTRLQHDLGLPSISSVQELIKSLVVHLARLDVNSPVYRFKS